MRGFPWRTVLLSSIAAYVILGVVAAAILYTGVYDVAATDAHWPITQRLLDFGRRHSVATHAQGIKPPANLDNPDRLALGVSHFAAHCAMCHGAPGVPKDDIAQGMYPSPPDLAIASQQYTDAQLFWILRHGIKMTGMPAWPDHSDDDLWAIVAFLKKLPGMSESDYAKLIMNNVMHGMMHHHGGDAPAENQ
jgi:mono/diheme cytochrome c family protein